MLGVKLSLKVLYFFLLHAQASIFRMGYLPGVKYEPADIHVLVTTSLIQSTNTHTHAHGGEQAYHRVVKGHHIYKDV